MLLNYKTLENSFFYVFSATKYLFFFLQSWFSFLRNILFLKVIKDQSSNIVYV